METLQKTIAQQEVQYSERQELVSVQNAQLESELQVLRKHIEEQKGVTELKSQIENELSKALAHLKEEKERNKQLQQKKMEVEAMFEQECVQASELKSKLECELARLTVSLNEEEQKNKLLGEEKSNVESLLKEDRDQAFVLKDKVEGELSRVQSLLMDEEQKNELLNLEKCKLISINEEKSRIAAELISQVKNELACVKHSLQVEELKNKELEQEKREMQTLNQEIANHMQQVQVLREYAGNLENEVSELKIRLAEEKDKSQMVEDNHSKIRALEEKVRKHHCESEEQVQQVIFLNSHLTNAADEVKTLSNLLAEEKHKNKDLLEWKEKAQGLVKEIEYLKEDMSSRTQQLQYLSSIESEASSLRDSLAEERQANVELVKWKSMAQNLEEEIKSLREEATIQNQEMERVKEYSSSLEIEAAKLRDLLKSVEVSVQDISKVEAKLTLETLEQSECKQEQPCVGNLLANDVLSTAGLEHIIHLEAEIQKLKEKLDQSYWGQSEKETMRLETEQAVEEQALRLQKLEREVLTLNRCISELQQENEALILLKMEKQTLLQEESCDRLESDKHLMEEQNGKETGHATDEIISQLKTEIETLRKALTDQEERHTEMNLKMYLKGQEAAKFERKDQVFNFQSTLLL